MVSRALFYQINQRLNEIFGYSGNEPFSELSFILFCDFFQLPLVKDLPVYTSAASIKGFIALDLWRKFQIVELTEVMRQWDGSEFISLLNKIREGEIYDLVENTLKSCILKEKSFPQHIVHMLAENKPAKEQNQTQLNTPDTQLILIHAIDEIPKDFVLSQREIGAIKQRKISETENVEGQWKLKLRAQVMLTSNLDIDDRLVNGLIGTVKQIKYKNNEFSIVYMKFNNNNAEREAMQSDVTARQHNWVPKKNIKHYLVFVKTSNNNL